MMSNNQPIYSYIAAMILGLTIVLIPELQPSPIPLVLINLTIGCLFGIIWSEQSWRWGLWIAGPMFVLIGLSVAFSGYLEIFLRRDLPIMVLVVVSACSGSFGGAWYKRRRKTG